MMMMMMDGWSMELMGWLYFEISIWLGSSSSLQFVLGIIIIAYYITSHHHNHHQTHSLLPPLPYPPPTPR